MEQGLPEELWRRIENIQREQGVATLEEKSQELTSLSQRVWQRVDTILQTLQGQTNSSVYEQAVQYKKWLESARSGEQRVAEAMTQVQKMKVLLGESREQIDAALPRGTLSEACRRSLEDVKKAASDIDAVLAERSRRIEEISTMAQDETSVRNELISEGASVDERGVFMHAFLPVAEKLREMKVSTECQDSYVSALAEKMQQFTIACQNDEVMKKRQALFEDLGNALDGYQNANAFLQEGLGVFHTMDQQSQALFKTCQSMGFAMSIPPMQPSQPSSQQPSQSSQQPSQQPSQPSQPQSYQPQPSSPQPQPYQPQSSSYQPPYIPPQQQQPYQPPYQPYVPPQQQQPYQPYQPYQSYQPYQQQSYTPYGQMSGKICPTCGCQNYPNAVNCTTCNRRLM